MLNALLKCNQCRNMLPLVYLSVCFRLLLVGIFSSTGLSVLVKHQQMGSYEASTKYTYKYLIRKRIVEIQCVRLLLHWKLLYSLFYELFSHKYFRNLGGKRLEECTQSLEGWKHFCIYAMMNSNTAFIAEVWNSSLGYFRRWSYFMLCQNAHINKKRLPISKQALIRWQTDDFLGTSQA